MYYVGVDIGGMSIKVGLVTIDGKILKSDAIPTQQDAGFESMVARTADLIRSIAKDCNVAESELGGIGIGIPGTVNSKEGIVSSAVNIGWFNAPIVEEMSKHFNIPVKAGNDANVAALGEQKFGSAKGLDHVVMITIGTGIGSGIIIDGKIYEGNGGAAAESGHQIIILDGELCNCGRCGCWERYASATALIQQTKSAMQANADSLMHNITKERGKVDGRTAFLASDAGDEAGKKVVNQYLRYLSAGLLNLAYVLHPQAFVIGGGVSHEGDNIMKPLQKFVDNSLDTSGMHPYIKVIQAVLGNNAGIIGAAAMVM